MNEWMWYVALLILTAGGVGLGFLWGRSATAEAKRAKTLEEELKATQEELRQYREEVTKHFATTAELVQRLTEDYRAVYRHLAEGSQALCGPDAPRLLRQPAPAPLEEPGEAVPAKTTDDEHKATAEPSSPASESAVRAAEAEEAPAPAHARAENAHTKDTTSASGEEPKASEEESGEKEAGDKIETDQAESAQPARKPEHAPPPNTPLH